MAILVKRVYEPPAEGDGHRVLVDRIWPRGLSRDAAAIDAWCKEFAPSTALRRWFDHDPERWEEFRERYFAELGAHEQELRVLAARGRLTLLFGARETRFNNAVALREYLRRG